MRPLLKNKRFVVGVAVVALGGLTLSACGSSDSSSPNTNSKTGTNSFGLKTVASVQELVPAALKSKGHISNSIYNDFAPEMFLENGKLVGIQVDLSEAVGAVMGIELRAVPTGAFDSIIPGLASGRYDMAAADFGVTAERVKQVDFVTQFDLGTGFIIKKGNAPINAEADLCGKKVGVLAGSYFVDQVKAASKNCTDDGSEALKISTFPTASAAILAVTNGRVEIVAEAQDAAGYQVKKQPALELGTHIAAPVPQAFGFPKDSKLVPAVQAAMVELVNNGTYKEILAKWGLEDAAYTDASNIKINNTVPVS